MIHGIGRLKAGLDKKKTAILTFLFFLLWYLNYCTPLIFDDYIYSFVFSDYSMGFPLPESAVRISSIKDIVLSQWNHYFFWGGRTVAHTLAQLFLWQGKYLFNILNAACFVLLLVEICWIVNKGEITFLFSKQELLYIFGLFWIFSIGLGDVSVWLTLSCNYLWTTVLLLGFLLIYEQHYFYGSIILKNKVFIFLFGLITGWTNENTICFVILVLLYYLFNLRKTGILLRTDIYLLYGFGGLCIGYLFLILAPGNFVRYIREAQDGVFLTGLTLYRRNIIAIIEIFALRCILYFYVFKGFLFLNKCELDEQQRKLLLISCVFTFFSFGSILIMLLSPEFRFRSSFPGLIFIIVATGLIRNVLRDRKQTIFKNNKRNVMCVLRFLAVLYVSVTVIGSIYAYSLQHQQTQLMLAEINKEKINPTGNVLVVQERPYRLRNYKLFNALTGFHLVFPYSIVADKNYWINKDVALYYGIQSISTEKEEDIWYQEE